jgi:hypothetical protein
VADSPQMPEKPSFPAETEPKKPAIAVTIDLDNIVRELAPIANDTHRSVAEALLMLLAKLSEIGNVIAVYVFIPPHLIGPPYQDFFFQQKSLPLFVFYCPQPPEAKPANPETPGIVDQFLIDFCRTTILAANIDYVCFVAGDGHYIPIAKTLQQAGKKIILAPASESSLSDGLKGLADPSLVFYLRKL